MTGTSLRMNEIVFEASILGTSFVAARETKRARAIVGPDRLLVK
jgi:hypothetical protein